MTDRNFILSGTCEDTGDTMYARVKEDGTIIWAAGMRINGGCRTDGSGPFTRDVAHRFPEPFALAALVKAQEKINLGKSWIHSARLELE